MRKRNFLSLAVVLIISYANLWSQDCCLKGVVVDAGSEEPIPYANVILTTQNDSTLIAGAITNENGFFTVDHITYGTYHLKTSFIGYQSVIMKDILIQRGIRDIGTIPLKVLTENLEGVTITATQPPITYKVDKKVIDAGSFPGANVAMDLLENVPSLQVDFEGNLTYRGDGTFKIFINGHPVSNGEEKLRQLPAEKIDKIEVITNPSAKYDAEGTAGIIQVILKKNRLQGYAINASMKVTSHKAYQGLFSIDKKGEKGGWYIEGNLARYIWSNWDSKEVRNVENDGISYKTLLENDGEMGGKRSYFEFGFNYDLTERDYIDFSLNINPFKNTEFNDIDGFILDEEYDTGGLLGKEEYALNSFRELFFSYIGSTLSYEHAFNKKRTHLLSAYLDYSSYLCDLEETQIDAKTYTDRIERHGYRGSEQNEIMVYGKVNYTLPLSEVTTLETGAKINTDHIPRVTSISGTFDEHENLTPYPWHPVNQTVDFLQNVYAGYFTFKSEWKKLAYQLGARIEYTKRRSDYRYLENSQEEVLVPTRKTFTDFFPTFHSTYSFTETHQLTASYSRRIQRPGYWNLIPLTQYDSPFSYYTGNGKLDPSYANAIEVGYKKSWDKDFIGFELFSRFTENVIQTYSRTDTSNVLMETPENIGNSMSIGAECMSGVDIFPFWNVNFSVSLFSYQLDTRIDDINKTEKQWKMNTRLNNTFLLPKSFTLKWDIHYNSPKITAQGRRDGYYYSNLALKKGFRDNKWQVTFAFSDLFSSVKYDTRTKGVGFVTEDTTEKDPCLSFKIAYSFDNQK